MVSLIVGCGIDLFLSESSRRSALEFQSASIASLSSFAPSGLLEQISTSAGQTSWHSPGGPYTMFLVPIRFVWNLNLNLIAQGTLGLSIVVLLDLAAVAVTIESFRQLYLALLDRLKHGAKQTNSDNLALATFPFVFGALFYAAAIAVISLFMGLLKYMALGALYVLGWVTSLAGLAAIVGTVSVPVYFVIVKASEKRLTEFGEALVGRLIGVRGQ